MLEIVAQAALIVLVLCIVAIWLVWVIEGTARTDAKERLALTAASAAIIFIISLSLIPG